MKQIFSQKEAKTLIGIIYTKKEFVEQEKRGVNISPDEAALQARAIKPSVDDKFPAHSHKPQDRETSETQESLVFIEGKGKIVFFDIDNTKIEECALEAGDLVLFLTGGHKLVLLEDSLIYEFKNGPYNGYEKDKELIDEK